jgi:uncharacterized protein (DUF433 family)
MAKLSANIRALAIKDIKAGMSTPELVTKYQVSHSAISYLRQKAAGSTPKLLEFKERIGTYSEERILRLFKQGDTPQELAKDYECSTKLMVDYLELIYPLSTRPRTSGKRIVLPKNRRK